MPITTGRGKKLKKAAPRSVGRVRQKAKRQKGKKRKMSITAARERKLGKAAPPSTVIYGGLCSTCETASTCTFPRDPERPIMHCDELDSRQVDIVAVERVPRAEPVSPKAVPEAEQEELGKYQGLCVNCENREVCTFPEPEGGVWHCDEYC